MRSPQVAWLAIFLAVFVWSAIEPKDRFTWFLEVLPALIGLVLVVTTRHRFPLTPMLSVLILVHCVVLMVGGHYTYAEVPLFDSMKDWFGFERNNYDKVGHLAQGFIPAILAREILIRKQAVELGGWLNLFVISVVLAFSAFYELLEWWVAAATGENAEAFLGTQGYAWDTQSDMMFALIGAVAALIFLARWHDRQLVQIDPAIQTKK